MFHCIFHINAKESQSSNKIRKISFSEEKHASIQKFEGIMRLFREDCILNTQNSCLQSLPVQRSNTLLIVAVPQEVDIKELSQDYEIENISILQQTNDAKYSAVLTFYKQSTADQFYTKYNAVNFKDLYETCYIAFLGSFEVHGSKTKLQYHWKELPTCPICLERLDISVSGMTGVLTSVYYSDAPSRWAAVQATCKVCTITKQNILSNEISCFRCKAQQNLWACLICGYLGCGRYVDQHAIEHWENSQHSYSLEVGTLRIWDYQKDAHVHRMMKTNVLQDIIMPDIEEFNVPTDKLPEQLEDIFNEYNYLLGKQLDEQRQFFEKQIEDLENQSTCTIQDLEGQFNSISIKEGPQIQLINEEIVKLKKQYEDLKIINESMTESLLEKQPEGLIFADGKSKIQYNQLQNLRKRVQQLMEALT